MRLLTVLGVISPLMEAQAADPSPPEPERVDPMTETNTNTNGATSKGSVGPGPQKGVGPVIPATASDAATYEALGESVQPLGRQLDKILKEARKLQPEDKALVGLVLKAKQAVSAIENHIVDHELSA